MTPALLALIHATLERAAEEGVAAMNRRANLDRTRYNAALADAKAEAKRLAISTFGALPDE
jgi:hypothetical protein